MYIYIYIHTCIIQHIHMYTYLSIYLSIYLSLHTYNKVLAIMLSIFAHFDSNSEKGSLEEKTK